MQVGMRVHTPEDGYRLEPAPPRPARTPHAANIIGAQANLWTEPVEDRGPGGLPGLPATRPVRRGDQVRAARAGRTRPRWLGTPTGRGALRQARRAERTCTARLPGAARPWQRRPGVPGHMHGKPRKSGRWRTDPRGRKAFPHPQGQWDWCCSGMWLAGCTHNRTLAGRPPFASSHCRRKNARTSRSE